MYEIAEPQRERRHGHIGIIEKKDMQVGTDVSKQEMIASQDWFYSELYRALLIGYFKKQKLPVPKSIKNAFAAFDHKNVRKPRTDLATGSEPRLLRSSSDLNWMEQPTKMICEPEIPYLISMLKGGQDKWSSRAVLKDLHE